MRVSLKDIAKTIGIPLTRLLEIEVGEEASLVELRDIAMCLSVSVRCLLRKKYFAPQILVIDLGIELNNKSHKKFYKGKWLGK